MIKIANQLISKNRDTCSTVQNNNLVRLQFTYHFKVYIYMPSKYMYLHKNVHVSRTSQPIVSLVYLKIPSMQEHIQTSKSPIVSALFEPYIYIFVKQPFPSFSVPIGKQNPIQTVVINKPVYKDINTDFHIHHYRRPITPL